MIHKIIKNSLPEYVAGCFLSMIFDSGNWAIDRTSNKVFDFNEYVKDPYTIIEKPQPTIAVLNGKVGKGNEELFGYSKSIFHHICSNNGIMHKKIERIFINANYEKLNYLESHTDSKSEKYNSMVIMLTPFMSQTGLVVGDMYIPYEFCKAVWFDSRDFHSATPLMEDHPLPRITLNYMFKV
jgi:hypothetical protein